MARQTLYSRILTAAITLFGRCRYDRISIRDIAREAGVMEAAIYRHFRSKERLYIVTLSSIVHRSVTDLAQFALDRLREQPIADENFGSLVTTAVRRWYLSLSKEGARLLQQAMMGNPGLKELAYSPLEQITSILTRAMQNFGKTEDACGGKTFAQTLIATLFQLKISQSRSESVELHEAERIIHDWIAKLPPDAS